MNLSMHCTEENFGQCLSIPHSMLTLFAEKKPQTRFFTYVNIRNRNEC